MTAVPVLRLDGYASASRPDDLERAALALAALVATLGDGMRIVRDERAGRPAGERERRLPKLSIDGMPHGGAPTVMTLTTAAGPGGIRGRALSVHAVRRVADADARALVAAIGTAIAEAVAARRHAPEGDAVDWAEGVALLEERRSGRRPVAVHLPTPWGPGAAVMEPDGGRRAIDGEGSERLLDAMPLVCNLATSPSWDGAATIHATPLFALPHADPVARLRAVARLKAIGALA